MSGKIRKGSSIIVVLLTCFLCVPAQSKAKKIDDLVRTFADAGQFSGVVLAAENGKIVYERAVGLANADFQIANSRDTHFAIASVTKLMTAVILARLVADKRLSMDDKLAKYFPDFPNGDKITIEMLSTHRSGIPHRVMEPEQESVPHSSAEMIERIKLAKLLFEPGTKRSYSSAGYTVLARVLEIASGKTYAQLLDQYVFAPAGMHDSQNFDSEMIISRRAQDYFLSPGGMINAGLKDYSFLVGAGSVFSTADDLERFAEAVVTGKYSEAVKATLLNQGETVAGSGSTNGHRAYLEIEKNNKWSYIVLANLGCGGFDLVQQAVHDIMSDKQAALPAPVRPKIVPDPNKDISEFAGTYRGADGSANPIVLRNGYLYSADIKMYPTGPDCFFDYRFFGNACFIRDTTGRIKELQWKGSNFSLTFARE